MKKRVLPLVILCLSVLIAVGSQTFLSPCVHEDGSFGACHWAGQAMLGLGCLTAVMGLLLLFRPGSRSGLFIAAAAAGVLGTLIPGTLIALCSMSAMRCRAIMQPAMTLLCCLVILAAAAGLILEERKGGRKP